MAIPIIPSAIGFGVTVAVGGLTKLALWGRKKYAMSKQCVMCGTTSTSLLNHLSCGHKIHDDCLEILRALRRRSGIYSNVCPIQGCNHQIPETTPQLPEENCVLCEGGETGPLQSLVCGHKYHERCLVEFEQISLIFGSNEKGCPLKDNHRESCRDTSGNKTRRLVEFQQIRLIFRHNQNYNATEKSSGKPNPSAQENETTQLLINCVFCEGEETGPLQGLNCGQKYHANCLVQFKGLRQLLGQENGTPRRLDSVGHLAEFQIIRQIFGRNRNESGGTPEAIPGSADPSDTSRLPNDCVVCEGEKTGPLHSLDCSHKYHEKCLVEFKLNRRLFGRNPNECPHSDCHRPINVTNCEESLSDDIAETSPGSADPSDTSRLPNDCVVCEGEKTGPLHSLDCSHKYHEECLVEFKLIRRLFGRNPNECPHSDCRRPINVTNCEESLSDDLAETSPTPTEPSVRVHSTPRLLDRVRRLNPFQLWRRRNESRDTPETFPASAGPSETSRQLNDSEVCDEEETGPLQSLDCGQRYQENCLVRPDNDCPRPINVTDLEESVSDDIAETSPTLTDTSVQENASSRLFEDCAFCGGKETGLLQSLDCGHKYHGNCLVQYTAITNRNECAQTGCKRPIDVTLVVRSHWQSKYPTSLPRRKTRNYM